MLIHKNLKRLATNFRSWYMHPFPSLFGGGGGGGGGRGKGGGSDSHQSASNLVSILAIPSHYFFGPPHTSLSKIPPILLKAGIWIPYFSSSFLMALICSSENKNEQQHIANLHLMLSKK